MLPGRIFSRVKTFIFLALGSICLVLGVIGYVLPGLPGTIWLIIAAAFFVRSSPRLYGLVVNNKYFGKQVRDFLETGAMPIKSKIFSIVSIWLFTCLSVFLGPYGLLFDVPILGLAVIGTIYILSRKSTKNA